MSIEYRGKDKQGRHKWRFRVNYNGDKFYDNYITEKAPKINDEGKEEPTKDVKDAHKAFEVDVSRKKIVHNPNLKFYDLAQTVVDICIKPLEAATLEKYTLALNNHILKVFGEENVSDINTLMVQNFVNDLSDKLAPGAVITVISVFKSVINKGVDLEIIPQVPYKKIKLPKVPKKDGEILPLEKIKTLLNSMDRMKMSWHKIALEIAVYGGLRKGEILGININDAINFKDNSIKVFRQYAKVKDKSTGKIKNEIKEKLKTDNSYRVVYLPKFVMDNIKDYINTLNPIPISGYLFINPETGDFYSKSSINKAFDTLLTQNKINHITIHGLRHLYATMMIGSGANSATVAKHLGDSIKVVEEVYVHHMEHLLISSLNAFENFTNEIKKAK